MKKKFTFLSHHHKSRGPSQWSGCSCYGPFEYFGYFRAVCFHRACFA